jgi:hypothetical protein
VEGEEKNKINILRNKTKTVMYKIFECIFIMVGGFMIGYWVGILLCKVIVYILNKN